MFRFRFGRSLAGAGEVGGMVALVNVKTDYRARATTIRFSKLHDLSQTWLTEDAPAGALFAAPSALAFLVNLSIARPLLTATLDGE